MDSCSAIVEKLRRHLTTPFMWGFYLDIQEKYQSLDPLPQPFK